MKSLLDIALQKRYERVKKLGDKLSEMDSLIDWEAFRPIVNALYDNKSEKGGRPNIDEVVMIKLLILQSWYGLTDQELEKRASDRISFLKFLGFPKTIPDYSTVWYFRERLSETGKDKDIWKELQRQLNAKGLTVKKGVIQDATFITTDPGHALADKPRGKNAKTRRSKDGTWTKKNNKSYFGYKLHSKVDRNYGLIRTIETTTASVHDSQIDLSRKGEIVYRDKGYFGTNPKGYDATMQRGVRDHPLDIKNKFRNKRIKKKRAPGERHYAVIKNVFKDGHVFVTTIRRVHVKMTFVCLSFDLYQLLTLQKQGVAIAI